MDRRAFLQTMSLPLAYPAWRAVGQSGERLERIGLQLYTVRDLMQADVGRTLQQVAAAGYREVEFAGYLDHAPPRLRTLLDGVGLAAPSSHVSLADLSRDAERTFDAAETIGHRYLILPWLNPEERTSLDDYRRVAAALNRAGERARGRGLRVGYHNHDFELAPVAGMRPYDLLLAETVPDLVCMEMDFFWMARGGADPLAYFERHPGRFHLCHVKDMDRGGEMVDVGAGRLDFRAMLRRRRTAGLHHFFVEHDQPADPIDSIRKSAAHLQRLEF